MRGFVNYPGKWADRAAAQEVFAAPQRMETALRRGSRQFKDAEWQAVRARLKRY